MGISIQLEIDGDIFAKMTLTYALGEKHGLWEKMKAKGGWAGST